MTLVTWSIRKPKITESKKFKLTKCMSQVIIVHHAWPGIITCTRSGL